MDFFHLAILVLFGLAISDLVVGVSNDAVNFLNSSVGSRVAPRHVIMVVASLGMLAGVTFSSGMMEVARKGIFNPQFFTMPELMVVFLAVMLTDIMLLDLYNTFGLPTSTTVSIVFELLGAAVAMSLLKLHRAGSGLGELVTYINTGKALTIIFGILLSVAVAFAAGALIQFVSRVLFTFDFERRLRRWGALWGGIALAAIVYFILIKGAKGASFLSDATVSWIKGHTHLILGGSFLVCAVLLQGLMLLTRVHILKVVVLVGTFALAMAFAANDLVNFIGVPLAGLSAFDVASDSGNLLGQTMDALRQPVRSNTLYLLIAGVIMVITLWVSRKARTVTKTEVRLGRQDEGYERFESTFLSQAIVRLVASVFESTTKIVPAPARRWIAHRFDRSAFRPAPAPDGTVPSFDLVRAAVNLMVASALISLATSYKLPLSTTYVTFMVAMGTSLSDQAWGRDSAVYRVTGVLTVIGGWFVTAMMAFTIAGVFAAFIDLGHTLAVLGLGLLITGVIVRNHRTHRVREQEEKALEVFNLRKIKDSEASITVTSQHAGAFLSVVREVFDTAYNGLVRLDRQAVKSARLRQRTLQQWSNIIAANIFKVLRLLSREDVEDTQRYAQSLSSLQEISESVRDIVMRCHVHVSNNHSGLLETQIAELDRIRDTLGDILEWTSSALLKKTRPRIGRINDAHRQLRMLVHEFDQNQIMRIQDNSSKTRLSILFYSFIWDALKISEQTMNLLTVFHEPMHLQEVATDEAQLSLPVPS
jgi:phosphate/sulfate permease